MNFRQNTFVVTTLTGIALMAFSRWLGFSLDVFAVGLTMLLLSSSAGCLTSSDTISGFRRFVLFSIGVIGLVSIPLILSAISLPEPYIFNSQLVSMLIAGTLSTIVCVVILSAVESHLVAKPTLEGE